MSVVVQTTGLNAPLAPANGAGSEAYTLDGRRLTGHPTAPGIYVIDGRKVVVK